MENNRLFPPRSLDSLEVNSLVKDRKNFFEQTNFHCYTPRTMKIARAMNSTQRKIAQVPITFIISNKKTILHMDSDRELRSRS